MLVKLRGVRNVAEFEGPSALPVVGLARRRIVTRRWRRGPRLFVAPLLNLPVNLLVVLIPTLLGLALALVLPLLLLLQGFRVRLRLREARPRDRQNGDDYFFHLSPLLV